MKLTNEQKRKRNKHVTKMLKELGIEVVYSTKEESSGCRIFPTRRTGGEWKLTLKKPRDIIRRWIKVFICKDCFTKYVGREPKESYTLGECSVCHSGDADEVTHYNMAFYTWICECYENFKSKWLN